MTHLKTCPLKNGPDKYVPRTPYDTVLEATFKKRKAVPLQVVGQQAGDNPPQQVANPQPEQEQPESTPPQAAETTPPQAAEITPPQAAETTPQQTGNPALIIMPVQAGDGDPQQQLDEQDEKEKSVFDEEAAKAVRSIEGEDLMQVLSEGIIPETGKSANKEGDGEEKPKEELDLEMVFDE